MLGSPSTASTSVVQWATSWRSAISRTACSRRPTRTGSTWTRLPSSSTTPPASRIGRIDRTRCWRYPIRPVTPFIAMRRVRVVMCSPVRRGGRRARARECAFQPSETRPGLSRTEGAPGLRTSGRGVPEHDLAADGDEPRIALLAERQRGHPAADVDHVDADRRERRGDVAERGDVVEAGEREVAWHGGAGLARRGHRPERHDVVDGEHELDVEVAAEELAHGRVTAVADERGEDDRLGGDGGTELGQGTGEALAPLRRGEVPLGPSEDGEAAVAQTVEPAGEVRRGPAVVDVDRTDVEDGLAHSCRRAAVFEVLGEGLAQPLVRAVVVLAAADDDDRARPQGLQGADEPDLPLGVVLGV